MYDMQHSCGSVNKVVGLYKANLGSIHARHQKTKPEITSMTEWNGSLLNSPADSQKLFSRLYACGSVAEWLGCWTCDQQVVGSNPSLSVVECNPGQVVNTHVPLSPSSIWYQPTGNDASRLGR